MSENLGLGQIITTPQPRDAIHIAVAPVVAGHTLHRGERVLVRDGEAVTALDDEAIGVVDPFLHGTVQPGDRFWLFLNPGSITSLRHDWTHPAFMAEEAAPSGKSASEQWMRAWAAEHMGYDYYGDGDDDRLSADESYRLAIDAGHTHRIGPYESARDHIDDEWWNHWQAITGGTPNRGEYFSCAC